MPLASEPVFAWLVRNSCLCCGWCWLELVAVVVVVVVVVVIVSASEHDELGDEAEVMADEIEQGDGGLNWRIWRCCCCW